MLDVAQEIHNVIQGIHHVAPEILQEIHLRWVQGDTVCHMGDTLCCTRDTLCCTGDPLCFTGDTQYFAGDTLFCTGGIHFVMQEIQ